jgi:hypothetical protein
MTESEVLVYFESWSNWGRWRDDEATTPRAAARAAHLARSGAVIRCSRGGVELVLCVAPMKVEERDPLWTRTRRDAAEATDRSYNPGADGDLRTVTPTGSRLVGVGKPDMLSR